MLSVKSMETAIGLITLIMAYFFAVTIAGVFRAYIAKTMGDDTPERLGFFSWNPFTHTDFIGLFFLMMFGFGWGRYIPINPMNIQGPFRSLKLLVAYLSDTCINIVMAIITLTSLIASFGVSILNIAIPMMFSHSLSQAAFAAVYPDKSSFAIAIAFVGIALLYLNVLFAVLNFIISSFGYLSMIFIDSFSKYGRYKDILIILVPMLIIFFFVGPLRLLVVYGIATAGYLIASICGIG